MNSQELMRQVTKFKARRTKTRLANYSTFISLFLLFSTLGSGFSLSSLLSFLLLLPLPSYFLIQSLKLTKKNLRLKEHSNIIMSTASALSSQFSFAKFITQPNLTFRLTLVLIILAFFTTIARARTPESKINSNQLTLTVSR